jgi:hypothetical protein
MDEGLDRAITIGIAPATYEANRQPGWNRHSFAYHADDGGYVTLNKILKIKGYFVKLGP